MKFKERYEEYVKSIKVDEFSTGTPVGYVQWLESLISDSVVTVEVLGGNVCETTRSKPHIWLVVKDYDNNEDPMGAYQDYSETIYVGW